MYPVFLAYLSIYLVQRLTLFTLNDSGKCHIFSEPILWVKSGYMFRGANGPIEKLEKLHQFRVIVYIRNPGRPLRSLPQKIKIARPFHRIHLHKPKQVWPKIKHWQARLIDQSSKKKPIKEKFKSLVGPRCTRGKICVWRNVNTVWRRSGAGSGTKEEMTESFLNGKSFSIEIAFLPQLWSCYVLNCPNSNNLYDHSNL